MSAPSDREPWLRKKAWAAREIWSRGTPSVFIRSLAYLFLVGAFLIWYARVLPPGQQAWTESVSIFLLGCTLIAAAVGGLRYFWLRHRQYGKSVCRLLTLPGVVGGWLKADVECALPLDSAEPVRIRLRNVVRTPRGGAYEVWRTEQTLASSPIQVLGTQRSVVRVQLRVPRDAAQEPLPINPSFLTALSEPFWFLEISKKTAGFDFFAQFEVPIYDVDYAPASEQGSDLSDGEKLSVKTEGPRPPSKAAHSAGKYLGRLVGRLLK